MQKPGEKGGEFQRKRILSLSFVHFIHDLFTSFLSPLLPLLIKKLDLSLTQAGSLWMLLRIPTFFNPFFGALSDRYKLSRILLVITPGSSALFMCLIGLAPTYGVLAALALAAGFSMAGMHLSAPVIISQSSGKSIGRGMSFFMVAGELARTLGPLAAVGAVSLLTLEGLWKLAPVGILTSFVLWRRLGKEIGGDSQSASPKALISVVFELRRVIFALSGMLIMRGFTAVAIETFLPTFIYQQGESLWFGSISLSVFEFCGACGALTTGTLSDRVGRRKALLAAAIASPPLMFFFLFSSGILRLVALVPLGFFTLSLSPVLMAVMLENAGENKGAANGVYTAMSFAFRAVIVIALGAISDAIGLRNAFMLSAALAFLGIPFVLLIPDDKKEN
ncbi:MAG: MFS transporter [Myxococcota bacterium]